MACMQICTTCSLQKIWIELKNILQTEIADMRIALCAGEKNVRERDGKKRNGE